MFPILSQIPAIHATIVGLLAAFYTAFFFYAYQKVMESFKKIEEATIFAGFISNPSYIQLNKYDVTFYDESGNLDWRGKCEPLINTAAKMFQHKPFIGNEKAKLEFENKVVETVEKISSLFHILFTTYPFTGTSIAKPQNTNLINKHKKFNYQRYNEIILIIQHLSHIGENYNQYLVMLFEEYDRIHSENKMQHAQTEIKKRYAQLDQIISTTTDPDIKSSLEKTKMEISQSINSFVRNQEVSNNLELMNDFFERVKIYKERVIPVINKSLAEFESYNNDFQIKKLSITMIGIILFILTFGIVLPLILVKESSYLNGSIFCFTRDFIEYSLLTISFLPYFVLCFYSFKKLKESPFTN